MRIIFESEEEKANFVEMMADSVEVPCPDSIGLIDERESCVGISCEDCWLSALEKSSEVKKGE